MVLVCRGLAGCRTQGEREGWDPSCIPTPSVHPRTGRLQASAPCVLSAPACLGPWAQPPCVPSPPPHPCSLPGRPAVRRAGHPAAAQPVQPAAGRLLAGPGGCLPAHEAHHRLAAGAPAHAAPLPPRRLTAAVPSGAEASSPRPAPACGPRCALPQPDPHPALPHPRAGLPGADLQLGRPLWLGRGARRLRLGRGAAAVRLRGVLDACVRHHLCAPGGGWGAPGLGWDALYIWALAWVGCCFVFCFFFGGGGARGPLLAWTSLASMESSRPSACRQAAARYRHISRKAR